MASSTLSPVASYPRHSCLGLIEATVPPDAITASAVVIRGTRASASLKHARRCSIVDPKGGYPRHSCLGLIEAPKMLKEGCLRARYPRHSCLGLIEASFMPDRRKATTRVIRGTRASASLKRRSIGGGITKGRVVIRGTRASASLKPAMPHSSAHKPTVIRGTRASASLKRSTPSSSALWSHRLSEALVPRPH